MPDKNKVAYTISEVILVIGIIGIIAALTIPQLIQNSNNKELVSGFLKTHSVLSNAFKEAEAVEETKVYKLSSLDDFKTFFEKHLKTQSNCDYDVCLADGSMFDYDTTFYQGCTNQAEGSSSALKESCLKLIVDVNGNKGPNTAGKDQYNLWVTRSGIIPEGLTDPETCSMDCGAYVLGYHRLFDNLNPFHYYSPIPNCETQDGNSCTSCKAGYEGEKCDTCSENYHGEGKSCYRDIARCESYNNGECTSCAYPYVNNNTSCDEKYENSVWVSEIGKYISIGALEIDYATAESFCTGKDMYIPDLAEIAEAYPYYKSLLDTYSDKSVYFWTTTPQPEPCSYSGGCVECYGDLRAVNGRRCSAAKVYNRTGENIGAFCLGNP